MEIPGSRGKPKLVINIYAEVRGQKRKNRGKREETYNQNKSEINGLHILFLSDVMSFA